MRYLIPAPYSGMSSWSAHQDREPPSSEPGTDYYMPRGTVLRAPSRCRVVVVGGGTQPATGRFVTLDDGTRWIRYLHMLRQDVRVGDELDPGEAFGLSGASGYGSEHFGASSDKDAAMIRRTGGPHVHVTAFRGRGYTFGSTGTVDFHALTGGAVAGGSNSTPGDNDMSVEDVYNARDNDGRNMLDLGRQIRSDISAVLENLTGAVRLDPDKDYAAFTRMLQRGFEFDIRPAGVGPDWKLGPTVFESLAAADDSADLGGIKVTLSDTDRTMIAKAVADAVKIPAGGATKADVEAAIKSGLSTLILKPAQ